MRPRKLLVLGLAGVLAAAAVVAVRDASDKADKANTAALFAAMDTANDDLATILAVPRFEPVSTVKPLVEKLGTDWQAIVVAARKVKGVYVGQVESNADELQKVVLAIVALPDSSFVADAVIEDSYQLDWATEQLLSTGMPRAVTYTYTPQRTTSASNLPGIEMVGEEQWPSLSSWIAGSRLCTVCSAPAPASPSKAARYQIRFEDRSQVVASGMYTDGYSYTALQGIVVVSVVDLQSQKVVGTRTFTGDMPSTDVPNTKSVSGASVSHRSEPDDREFASWLRDLMSTLGK
jgi:hypothetical protein